MRDEVPRVVSYADFDAMCNSVARGLRRQGVTAGDRVGILSLNRVEYLAVVFGSIRAGVVPVPVNIKLKSDAVRSILVDCSAAMVFAESRFLDLSEKDIPTVVFDAVDKRAFNLFVDVGEFQAIDPTPETIAIQPYTSGSTGRPKGVLLTHASQNWARKTLAHFRKTKPDDVFLVAAPLYHKNALLAVKQALTAGATIPLLPQFDIKRYLQAIEQFHATIISGVPTMIAMLLSDRETLARYDVSSVKLISIGSAPASASLVNAMLDVFPQAEVMLNYGVTEGGPVPFGPHPNGEPRPQGSVGYPWPGTEAKLLGGASEDQGELWLRNPGILSGYHNLPHETSTRLQDGFYRTGDVFRRDQNGFYFFVGRTDDMFNCGGENIFPAEVEAILDRHPGVQQSIVVPVGHEFKGQVPHAFIIRRANSKLTEDELKRFALDNAPPYMHPRRVHFIENFPLSGTNKIDRRQLAAMASGSANE